MPTTICSFCDNRIDAMRLNETDTMFDWRCPECGKPVMIDGSAKEKRRQRQARERISTQIQSLADEIDTPGYQPSPYSVEDLQDRVQEILNEIDQELDRR